MKELIFFARYPPKFRFDFAEFFFLKTPQSLVKKNREIRAKANLRSIYFSAIDRQQLLLSLMDEEGLPGHVGIGRCMPAYMCRVDLRQPVRACGCCGEADVLATIYDSESRGILSSWF